MKRDLNDKIPPPTQRRNGTARSTRKSRTPTRTHAHEPLGPDDRLAPLPPNPYKRHRGITRAWYALKHSLNGFRVAIREESAFRQEPRSLR